MLSLDELTEFRHDAVVLSALSTPEFHQAVLPGDLRLKIEARRALLALRDIVGDYEIPRLKGRHRAAPRRPGR